MPKYSPLNKHLVSIVVFDYVSNGSFGVITLPLARAAMEMTVNIFHKSTEPCWYNDNNTKHKKCVYISWDMLHMSTCFTCSVHILDMSNAGANMAIIPNILCQLGGILE